MLIDTGATCHIVNDSSLLHHIVPIDPVIINGVGGNITARAIGYLGLYGPAFYAKDFKHNILSVSCLCDSSCQPQFTQDPDIPFLECLRVSHPDFHDLHFKGLEDFTSATFPRFGTIQTTIWTCRFPHRACQPIQPSASTTPMFSSSSPSKKSIVPMASED